MTTRLKNSYVKHFDFTKNEYLEGYNNHFEGIIQSDGQIVGVMVNSFGELSSLTGKIYRLWRFRFLNGVATGYPNHPNGAPYIKFAFVTNKRSYGLLLGQRGFVFIRCDRIKEPS